MNKSVAGNIDEYYSFNEKATGIVIRLNKRYKLKVVRGLAPISRHDDRLVERFYEDMERAMAKIKTQYTVVMGDFNAKVCKKQAGDKAVGNYGLGCRNNRGDLLVEFDSGKNVRIIDTCQAIVPQTSTAHSMIMRVRLSLSSTVVNSASSV